MRVSFAAAWALAFALLWASPTRAVPSGPAARHPAAAADAAHTGEPTPTASPPAPALALWPPAPLAEMPDRDPVRSAIDRAWRLPANSLEERVARTQRAGLSLGLRDLDGPARALLLSEEHGGAFERAAQAVRLAPNLPAAQASLAQAQLERGSIPEGLRTLGTALDVVPKHLEARAWMAATVSQAATLAALGWAALFLFLGAASSLPTLMYGLGATRLKLSGPASLAMIGALPMGLALHEGPAGAALGLAAIAAASGSAAKRIASVAVASVGLIALYSGADRVALGRMLLVADPLAVAVHRIEAGLPTSDDVGVALRAAGADEAAAQAVAVRAKRVGEREVAAQGFARILDRRPTADVFNNAANIEYARGDLARAIELYEKATKLEPSAIAYLNLSQAYGQAIRLDDQDRALLSAQALDSAAVELWSGHALGNEAFVTDVSLPAASVAARAAKMDAPAQLAAALRARLAPGWIGGGWRTAALLMAIVLIAAAAAARALERAAGPRDFYADLARTLRSGVGDSAQRVAQLNRLRTQRARADRLLTVVALIVPGAAGFRFGRPVAALIAAAAFAIGVAAACAWLFAPPDPMAVGPLPGMLSRAVVLACALTYVFSTAAAFVLRLEE
ncbi:MAG: tetratricopeptide repeat protein [Myxococcota bacterium]